MSWPSTSYLCSSWDHVLGGLVGSVGCVHRRHPIDRQRHPTVGRRLRPLLRLCPLRAGANDAELGQALELLGLDAKPATRHLDVVLAE